MSDKHLPTYTGLVYYIVLISEILKKILTIETDADTTVTSVPSIAILSISAAHTSLIMRCVLYLEPRSIYQP